MLIEMYLVPDLDKEPEKKDILASHGHQKGSLWCSAFELIVILFISIVMLAVEGNYTRNGSVPIPSRCRMAIRNWDR